jgi:hypothetical protein
MTLNGDLFCISHWFLLQLSKKLKCSLRVAADKLRNRLAYYVPVVSIIKMPPKTERPPNGKFWTKDSLIDAGYAEKRHNPVPASFADEIIDSYLGTVFFAYREVLPEGIGPHIGCTNDLLEPYRKSISLVFDRLWMQERRAKIKF